MAFSHTIKREVKVGSVTISQSVTNSADAEDNRDITVADASTDLQVAIDIDVSEIKSLYLESDQNVTVETNNGTTPDDTIALKANDPLVWTPNSAFTNPLGTDVTDFFITNSSGATATVRLRLLQDSTP